MKKIVKVVALLSIVAAVMMGCKNPAGGNTDDPTGGNTTGGSTTGGSTNDSDTPAPGGDTTKPADTTPAPQTKFTNAAWVATGITEAYGGVYIDYANIGVPANFKITDYDYIKVNATLSKAGEEVTTAWKTGFIHFQDEDEVNHTVQNINNGFSSKYGSVYLPVADLGGKALKKIMVQNAQDNVDTIKVNYIEFVKVEDGAIPVANLDDAVAKGSAGKKVVFHVVYDDTAKANNGVGQLQLNEKPWTASSVTFVATAKVSDGEENFEVAYADVKSVYDAGYTATSFYNGANLQYIYLK